MFDTLLLCVSSLAPIAHSSDNSIAMHVVNLFQPYNACSLLVCFRLNEIHCSMFIACGVIIIVGTFFGAIHVFTLILCLTRFQFFYLLHPVWIPLAFLLNRSLTISAIRDRMLVLFSVIQRHDEDKVRFHSQLHELQNNQSTLKKKSTQQQQQQQ